MAAGMLSRLLERLAIARPAARAWAMYDWANSAMVTVIVTAVFPVYFMDVAAEPLGDASAQKSFTLATTAALIVIAVIAPLLGAVADARAVRKKLLVAFAGLGVVSTAAMFGLQSGDWELALVLFALANIGAAGSFVFYDALLPHVAGPGEVDRLSTTGYALGYVGGGLLLALNIAWIRWPGAFGLPAGEGLSASAATLPARLAFLSVAVWWALFTIPLLRHVGEPPADVRASRGGVRGSIARLLETFRELRRHPQTLWMLVAFLIYNDGIVTVIRMAAVYAKGKHLGTDVIIATVLLVQFAGIPFAILFGRLSVRFGAKPLIVVGLCVYVLLCVFAYRMSTNAHFVVLGFMVATVQGGCQALSRSLFAQLIPRDRSGQYFALFAVGEKFAGIFGPLAFGLALHFTTVQGAILSVIPFFVVGGLLLLRVDVEEGRRAAQRSSAAHAIGSHGQSM